MSGSVLSFSAGFLNFLVWLVWSWLGWSCADVVRQFRCSPVPRPRRQSCARVDLGRDCGRTLTRKTDQIARPSAAAAARTGAHQPSSGRPASAAPGSHTLTFNYSKLSLIYYFSLARASTLEEAFNYGARVNWGNQWGGGTKSPMIL